MGQASEQANTQTAGRQAGRRAGGRRCSSTPVPGNYLQCGAASNLVLPEFAAALQNDPPHAQHELIWSGTQPLEHLLLDLLDLRIGPHDHPAAPLVSSLSVEDLGLHGKLEEIVLAGQVPCTALGVEALGEGLHAHPLLHQESRRFLVAGVRQGVLTPQELSVWKSHRVLVAAARQGVLRPQELSVLKSHGVLGHGRCASGRHALPQQTFLRLLAVPVCMRGALVLIRCKSGHLLAGHHGEDRGPILEAVRGQLGRPDYAVAGE
mmetsp:Transcript_67066/g.207375  ORF Transcript_67066/g.207375 Transcript_67066/m.207375 type:complete len:264 (+) Transcript_67066:106-897(+)